MKRTIILGFCALATAIAPAFAETFDFSQPLTLSPTQAAGAWYTDRFAPAGFASQSTAPDSTTNTLKLSIDASQTQTQSFYNTQGRKYDLSNDNAVSIQLYVNNAWATDTNEREAGFWSTTDTVGYGIIEFQSKITSGTYANGGTAGFYGWNNQTSDWTLITATDFSYGGWATLTMALTGGGAIDYTVNGTTVQSALNGYADNYITNVMLQGYNGSIGEVPQSQDIFWNNLNASPEPGTIATMVGGLGLVALGIRRRRAAQQS